jgi:peptide/nickel transport system permease protein
MPAMTIPADTKQKPTARFQVLRLIARNKLALAAVIFLTLVVLCAIFGPWLMGNLVDKPNFRARNMAPFSLSLGWAYVLGADTLGRSLLARLIVGAQNTLGIALFAVFFSMLIGGFLGLIA